MYDINVCFDGSAPIFTGDGEGTGGFGAPSFDFGVDPSLDPELALALKFSSEQESARQEAAA